MPLKANFRTNTNSRKKHIKFQTTKKELAEQPQPTKSGTKLIIKHERKLSVETINQALSMHGLIATNTE